MTEPTPIGTAAQRWAEKVGHPSAMPAEPSTTVPGVPELGDLAASDLREWRIELLRQRWAAMPRRFRDASLEDLRATPAIYAVLEGWARDATTGAPLVLLGPVGTGKTHAAFAAMRARLTITVERGGEPAGLAYTVPTLLDLLRPKDEGDAFRTTITTVAATPLLLLDDLGAERATEWVVETLAALMDHRWLEMLPTIVTTNLTTRDELSERYTERLASRLLDGATVVRLAGEDRRR